MKPIDIRVTNNKYSSFDKVLIANVELTKDNVAIQCSIENVETAFKELDKLNSDMRTIPCSQLPKGIKRDIGRLTKYIKAESKNIKRELKILRKGK